ncbi:MAG: metalloregulator ArsR/SmtB family transcription factor [Treponema sp.]|jgi:DNA-binding transcriptional ArsR family regulator|nr:metalloregulator ArsR/SmtB family transcription factor [Treponema sp.]
MEEKAKALAEMLKILANENRLLILCALVQGAKTVNLIGEFVPKISQSALSQHLHLLKTAGILASDKHGLNVTYSIADHRVEEIFTVLKKHYCDEPEVTGVVR